MYEYVCMKGGPKDPTLAPRPSMIYCALFRGRNIWKTSIKQGFDRNEEFHLPLRSKITNLTDLWTDPLLTYIPMARFLSENCDLKSLISASYFEL
jgi:hypothetical protein